MLNLFSINKEILPRRIHAFHASMFHGVSDVLLSTNRYSHFAGDNLMEPLRIRRTGINIPDVFVPSNSLVVSRRVRDTLGDLPNVDYLRVEFTQLIDIEYQAGDFDYPSLLLKRYNIKDVTDTDCLYDRLPDVPRLYTGLGDYYETVTPRLSDIRLRYDGLRTVRCRPSSTADEVELTLSERLCDENPMLWHFYSFITERVYERLERFIDHDYFETSVLSI
jgi:hypothetical protein